MRAPLRHSAHARSRSGPPASSAVAWLARGSGKHRACTGMLACVAEPVPPHPCNAVTPPAPPPPRAGATSRQWALAPSPTWSSSPIPGPWSPPPSRSCSARTAPRKRCVLRRKLDAKCGGPCTGPRPRGRGCPVAPRLASRQEGQTGHRGIRGGTRRACASSGNRPRAPVLELESVVLFIVEFVAGAWIGARAGPRWVAVSARTLRSPPIPADPRRSPFLGRTPRAQEREVAIARGLRDIKGLLLPYCPIHHLWWTPLGTSLAPTSVRVVRLVV